LDLGRRAGDLWSPGPIRDSSGNCRRCGIAASGRIGKDPRAGNGNRGAEPDSHASLPSAGDHDEITAVRFNSRVLFASDCRVIV
jgi:hypothetical protein